MIDKVVKFQNPIGSPGGELTGGLERILNFLENEFVKFLTSWKIERSYELLIKNLAKIVTIGR